MNVDRRVSAFCVKLIAAADAKRGVKWPAFVSHNQVAAELARIGYKPVQSTAPPGATWIAMRLSISTEMAAQIRALQFVRNLGPEQIDKIIDDVRAGKVTL